MTTATNLIEKYKIDQQSMIAMREQLAQIEKKYYTDAPEYMNTAFSVVSGYRYETDGTFSSSDSRCEVRLESVLFKVLLNKLHDYFGRHVNKNDLKSLIRVYINRDIDGFPNLQPDNRRKNILNVVRHNMSHILAYLNSNRFGGSLKTQIKVPRSFFNGYIYGLGRSVFDDTPEVLKFMVYRYNLYKIVVDETDIKLVFKTQKNKQAFLDRLIK